MSLATMPTPTVPFADKLREKRNALGLTLAALADRAGMHLQSLAKIESGARPSPTWESVVALSQALGVTPDYFYEPLPQPESAAPPAKAMGKRK